MSRHAQRSLFWSLFAFTAVVYATMLAWTLPAIAGAAGGLAAFDMRPQGYSLDDAVAFLSALSSDGLSLYRNVQLKLDLVYPAALALLLALSIRALLPKGMGPWRWAAGLITLPVAIFDYLENAGIDAMLAKGLAIYPSLAATTSQWTILKGQATTLAMSMLLVLIVWQLGRAFLQRRRGLAA